MLPFLLLLLSFILPFLAAEVSPSSLARPDCQEKCGNVNIPYPFGIGTGDSRCYHDTNFRINCNDSFTPPKPFLYDDMEIIEFSTAGYLRSLEWMSSVCYSDDTLLGDNSAAYRNLSGTPYIFSAARNQFTVIGCDTSSLLYSVNSIFGNGTREYASACISLCNNKTSLINGSCDGTGCCQQSIPKGLKDFELFPYRFNNDSGVSHFNPCSYAFLVEVDRFNFSMEYLHQRNFSARKFPLVLDWAIRDQERCQEARKARTYACGENTGCFGSDNGPGYLCKCSRGYQGNPYLKDGCRGSDRGIYGER